MTYQELLTQLKALTPEQLKYDVLYQNTNDGAFYDLLGIRSGVDYDEDPDQFFLDIEQ